MEIRTMSAIALSALNRFGLGAGPSQPAVSSDPRGWLKQQLKQTALPDTLVKLPNSLVYMQRQRAFLQQRQERLERKKVSGPENNAIAMQTVAQEKSKSQMPVNDSNLYREALRDEAAARLQLAISTPNDFYERLAHFWSNHFAVSVDKRAASLFAAPMEREAIRPNLNGVFSDMLIAVTQHPAMLFYLDNVRSVGEDSRAVARSKKNSKKASGLNENLAREILELHTLGSKGGYTQNDVTEFAKALTGWSVPRRPELDSAKSAFTFYPQAHEPGERRVVGKTYRDEGMQQAKMILQDLALHPSTAKHLAFKLARHFVSDTPPPSLVAAMANAYLKSGTQLEPMYHAMINNNEAWSSQARKFKTPTEFVVSAFRSTGTVLKGHERDVYVLLERMGHLPFMSRSPEGYGDALADWSGPDALFKRLQAASTLAHWAPRADNGSVLATAKLAVSSHALDQEMISMIQRAESSHQALSLLFASPAFQWRI
jgi:uncharacterized protein (DUF1800 family)